MQYEMLSVAVEAVNRPTSVHNRTVSQSPQYIKDSWQQLVEFPEMGVLG